VRERQLKHDPEKACPRLDPWWTPVSRLREAPAIALPGELVPSAGDGRSEKIMLKEQPKRNTEST
jgi:hypothetical protein